MPSTTIPKPARWVLNAYLFASYYFVLAVAAGFAIGVVEGLLSTNMLESERFIGSVTLIVLLGFSFYSYKEKDKLYLCTKK